MSLFEAAYKYYGIIGTIREGLDDCSRDKFYKRAAYEKQYTITFEFERRKIDRLVATNNPDGWDISMWESFELLSANYIKIETYDTFESWIRTFSVEVSNKEVREEWRKIFESQKEGAKQLRYLLGDKYDEFMKAAQFGLPNNMSWYLEQPEIAINEDLRRVQEK